MNNKIKVLNENGELEEVEVIDFFRLDEFDHEYVLYTKNEESGNDIITYVSIINEVADGEFQFEGITNKDEEAKVEKKMQEEIDSLLKQ